ncbi:glycosyltransferase family 2 protein [bacterium]|nr:glycosyltransferase family 2 protein [bacterium]
MTVSFIVTSYNYSMYIEETIQSIKNQSYKDFEIIVVDDASKDSSIAILENTDGIKLIKHSENKGQLAAIITGLKEAKGDFISIIDSDDTINSEYANILINKLKTNNVSLVNCNCKKNKLLTTENTAFGGWYWSPMSCGMFKKEALNCILEYKNTNNWKICPDKFLFNLAFLQGNSMLIADNLVNKREHEQNAGKRKGRLFVNIKNNLIIRKEALKIIQNKDLRKKIIHSYSYLINQLIEKFL